MIDELKQLGVKHRISKGCKCNNSYITHMYTLPKGLDANIVKHLTSLGNPALPFSRVSLLRIENKNYSIIGVKRLKEVKIILKTNEDDNIISQFERSLVNYLKE